MNYNYGRFIEEKFEYAPRVLIIGDKRIINPTEGYFLQAGYKKITKTEMIVKEGYYYTSKFIDSGDVIIQEWEEHEVEKEDDTHEVIEPEVSKSDSNIENEDIYDLNSIYN